MLAAASACGQDAKTRTCLVYFACLVRQGVFPVGAMTAAPPFLAAPPILKSELPQPSPRLCLVSDLIAPNQNQGNAIQEKVTKQEPTTLFVHHFGVAHPLLDEFLKNSRFGPPQADHFFDTANFLLMRCNIWLRQRCTKQGTEWNLKRLTIHPQFPHALAVSEVITRETEINAELRVLGLRGLEDVKLAASISFCRSIITEDKDDRLWVDCALIDGKYYIIGGCSYSTPEGLDRLRRRLVDRPGYIQWVRSKVLEYLFAKNRHLYDGLIALRVLPELSYHVAHELNKPPNACSFLREDGSNAPTVPTRFPTFLPDVPLFPSEMLELEGLKKRYCEFKPSGTSCPSQELQFYRCVAAYDDWTSD